MPDPRPVTYAGTLAYGDWHQGATAREIVIDQRASRPLGGITRSSRPAVTLAACEPGPHPAYGAAQAVRMADEHRNLTMFGPGVPLEAWLLPVRGYGYDFMVIPAEWPARG
jgi:hypothetical protein